MQTSMEETGQLTARIKIRLEEEDFQPKVESKLKELRRSASMPGFRTGKVPEGMIRRMYEKSILVEEVDKMLSETLSDYLRENELNILGYPLSNETDSPEVNWEEKAFEFWFDIGLAPEIDKDLGSIEGLVMYEVKAEDKEVNETIENLRKRDGSEVETEQSELNNIVYGNIVELDESGERKEDGLTHYTTILPESLKDESIQALFTGLKTADTFVFNPAIAVGNNQYELASMLGISADEATGVKSDFRFTVDKIVSKEPAEMNEAFFLKMFPGEESMDEEGFRQKVRKVIEERLQEQAQDWAVAQAVKKLTEPERMPMPEAFLRQWMMRSPKNNMSEEQMEQEFPSFLRSMRYMVLQESLMDLYEIKITEQDLRLHIQSIFRTQFHIGTDDQNDQLDPMLASLVDSVLENKEEIGRIRDQVTDIKFTRLLSETLSFDRQSITSGEFEKIIKETNKRNE